MRGVTSRIFSLRGIRCEWAASTRAGVELFSLIHLLLTNPLVNDGSGLFYCMLHVERKECIAWLLAFCDLTWRRSLLLFMPGTRLLLRSESCAGSPVGKEFKERNTKLLVYPSLSLGPKRLPFLHVHGQSNRFCTPIIQNIHWKRQRRWIKTLFLQTQCSLFISTYSMLLCCCGMVE